MQAPPKLAVVPKVCSLAIVSNCKKNSVVLLVQMIICMFIWQARKSTLSASQERLRLEAIDAYRSRKGWIARPGVPIPAVVMQ